MLSLRRLRINILSKCAIVLWQRMFVCVRRKFQGQQSVVASRLLCAMWLPSRFNQSIGMHSASEDNWRIFGCTDRLRLAFILGVTPLITSASTNELNSGFPFRTQLAETKSTLKMRVFVCVAESTQNHYDFIRKLGFILTLTNVLRLCVDAEHSDSVVDRR